MMPTPRTDQSVLGRWWMSVDRWTLGAVIGLIIFGVFMVSAASPSVAERIGLTPFYFVKRHLIFLVPTMMGFFIMALASLKTVWRISSLVFIGSVVMVGLTLVAGPEIKGATRWIHVFGFSLQPSEFLKPSLIVVTAWLIARVQREDNFPGYKIAIAAYLISAGGLILQPDFGMTFVLSVVWGIQIYLAGLPLFLIMVLGGLGIGGIIAAYVFLPHVASRIDRFLDPTSGDNYQVQKSLDAFGNGGLFGTGPAHGQVKMTLPDAHADFIFAVAGEEMGLLFAVGLVGLFCFIIIRSALRIRHSDDMFVILGTGGLLAQFALQSLIHMGSSLQLLPAKGMTLPFISYGGSSLLAMGYSMGVLLALTRKRTAVTPLNAPRHWTPRS